MLFINHALLVLPSTIAFTDRAAHERARPRSRSLHGRAVMKQNHDGETLSKRDSYNGRATFYDVGLGACGGYNVASDYIVAQNSAQFGSSYPSPNCGKSITISYNGITAVASIQDECPTCGYGSLDMSRGLFDHFASEDMGEFQMTWWYNDGSSSQTTTTSHTPTSTYVAPSSTYTPPSTTSTTPTSTYVAPTTTSTYATPTTTSTFITSTISTTSSDTSSASSSFPSLSSLSTTFANSTSASPTSTSIPTPTTSAFPDIVTDNADANATSTFTSAGYDPIPTYADPSEGNLVLFNQAVAYLGHIVVVGAGGK